MSLRKYRIYTLSARAVMSHGKENGDGCYAFELNNKATEKCKLHSHSEQEDNALFYPL